MCCVECDVVLWGMGVGYGISGSAFGFRGDDVGPRR